MAGLPNFGNPSEATKEAIREAASAAFGKFIEEERQRRMQPLTGGVIFNVCPHCNRTHK